jgi:hypothetical protein
LPEPRDVNSSIELGVYQANNISSRDEKQKHAQYEYTTREINKESVVWISIRRG